MFFSGSEGRGQLWCCIWPLPPISLVTTLAFQGGFIFLGSTETGSGQEIDAAMWQSRTRRPDKPHNYKEFLDLHEEFHKEPGICKDLPKLQITFLKTSDNKCIVVMVVFMSHLYFLKIPSIPNIPIQRSSEQFKWTQINFINPALEKMNNKSSWASKILLEKMINE